MTRFEIVLTGLRVTWFVEATFCALNFAALAFFAVRRKATGRHVPFSAEMSLAIFLSSSVGMYFAAYGQLWHAVDSIRPVMWPATVGIGVLIISLSLYNLSTAGANERRAWGWIGIVSALICGVTAAIFGANLR